MKDAIVHNLATIHQRIAQAAHACQRDPASIQLLAVSKRQPVEAIEQAWQAGQYAFGENYLQEALEKITTLKSKPINWHFIGALQSNKATAVAHHFDWVHSIHTLKIAQKLAQQRSEAQPPLNVCLQINLDAEPTKSGIALAELSALAVQVASLEKLCLRGLMALPAPRLGFVEQCRAYAPLQEAFTALQAAYPSCDTLSIGTSADLEAAITMGATCVRIGEGIFGPRPI